MNPATLGRNAPISTPAFRLLVLGALFAACSPAATDKSKNPPPSTATGGSGGSPINGTGGSGGSTTTTGGSGGSTTTTGGSGGSSTGGSGGSSTGGSGGSSTGGSGGTGGSSGKLDGGSTPGKTDGSSPPAADGGPSSGGGKHPIMAGNKLVNCKATGFHLTGTPPPAADFCSFYEAYCPYDPDSTMLNKGKTPAERPDAKSLEPWFYKSYDDCVMKYTAASDGAKNCRAGQLCSTMFMEKPFAQGCTHATGHFDGTCVK